jgi:hypothetical protein
VVFLYTSNEKKKDLGINLAKRDLYNENCKTLKKEIKDHWGKKKEIKDDTRRWTDYPCSWISRINILKMATILKEIYRFN